MEDKASISQTCPHLFDSLWIEKDLKHCKEQIDKDHLTNSVEYLLVMTIEAVGKVLPHIC